MDEILATLLRQYGIGGPPTQQPSGMGILNGNIVAPQPQAPMMQSAPEIEINRDPVQYGPAQEALRRQLFDRSMRTPSINRSTSVPYFQKSPSGGFVRG